MRTLQSLERDLRRAGRDLSYPSTPPIAAQVMARLQNRTARRSGWAGWRWAAIAILVLLAVLLLVPPARAAVLDIIQIGVVRILRLPNPPSSPTALPSLGHTQIPEAPGTATAAPTLIPLLPNLAGATTLQSAQAQVDFPILLPAYPHDLGQPDRVFLQSMGSPMLILVWLDPDHPGQVLMSLDEIAPGNWSIAKYNPPVLQEVTVRGQRGVWTEGPYLLQATNGSYVTQQMVEGHALIWTDGRITYRLETTLSLEESLKVAESLVPVALSSPRPP